jgi:fumarate hydratase class I
VTAPLDVDSPVTSPARPSGFRYSPMYPLGADATPWRKLDITGVSTATCDGRTVLKVQPAALEQLAFAACRDVSHLLRPGHLQQLANILKDPRRRRTTASWRSTC